MLWVGFESTHRMKVLEHIDIDNVKDACIRGLRQPADAHHLRFTQPRAMGRKVSNEFAVPLCRTHHRDNHRIGDEAAWWDRQAVDPLGASRQLWVSTRRIE